MKLTYPKSHTTKEIRPLYEEFLASYPEVFKEWLKIETKGRKMDEDELRPIIEIICDFLKSKTEWETDYAVLLAVLDFRQTMVKENLGYSLIPERN